MLHSIKMRDKHDEFTHFHRSTTEELNVLEDLTQILKKLLFLLKQLHCYRRLHF